MMTDFGVVTANLPVRMHRDKWREFHKKNIRPVASIVCCQESPHRANDVAVAYDVARTQWKWFGEMTPINQPFIVDLSVWEVLGQHSYKATSATRVGPAGAGPDVLLAKYIHWMVLKHRATHKVVAVFNNHAVPSIYLHVRDQLHEEHMRDLGAQVRRTDTRVIVCGDMNAEWTNPNFAPLKKAGLIKDNPKGPTHGDRQIDLILHRNARKGGGIHKTGGKVLPLGAPNDHHPVLVTYSF